MKKGHLRAIENLMESNKNMVLLISDNAEETHKRIKEKWPQRCINYGISESNMLASAAGISESGLIPVVYSVSNFLSMRGYEFIRNMICLQNKNVKIVGINSGLSTGHMGPTHQATEDIAIMRSLPNITLISPSNANLAEQATYQMVDYKGPVYLRLERDEIKAYDEIAKAEFRVGEPIEVLHGEDIVFISTGAIIRESIEAALNLKTQGISAGIVDINTIKPLNKHILTSILKPYKAVITVEEHNVIGGLGGAVAEILMELGKSNLKFKRMGFEDTFVYQYGTRKELWEFYGLSQKHLEKAAKELLGINS